MWNVEVWKQLLLVAMIIVGVIVVTKFTYRYFGEEVEEQTTIHLGTSY